MNSASICRNLLCLVIAFCPLEVRAQAMSVSPGNRVRVWSEDHPRTRFTGALHDWTADSLTLQPKGSNAQPIQLARASISRLEVRKAASKSEAVMFGALIGGTSAAGLIALAHGLAEGLGGDGGWSNSATPYLVVAGSATLGGLSGLAFRGSLGRWRRVPPDSVLFLPRQLNSIHDRGSIRALR